MKLSKSHLKTLSAIQQVAEGHDASEALKRTFSDKHEKVLSELSREPAVLASFFAAMELSASAATARLIATHAMRADEVTDLVKKRKAEEANRVAQGRWKPVKTPVR